MKIGIFTSRSLHPVHPRLAAFLEYFDEMGIVYDLIPALKHKLFSRINWISLFFFDNWSVHISKKKSENYDVVLINDLKLLPIAKHAKRCKKTVLYETIDNNVSLRNYSLQKKIPFTKLLSAGIIKYYSGKEIKLVQKYCDTVIVNSRSLVEYFGSKSELIYYYSFFEKINGINDSKKKPALLYLGEFSDEKGATEILELRKKISIELFIFGTIYSESFVKETENPGIVHTPKIGQEELLKQIGILFKNYFLIGVSFIKPVHFSYATQESNKDIDYLALGVPIIGNHRQPTEEKILAGCGIFPENETDLNRLISDESFKYSLSENCRIYYQKNYSRKIFRSGMDKIFGKYSV